MDTVIRILCLVLLVGLSGSASADRIDDYVVAEMGKQQLAGVALAVVKDGKTLKMKTYGLSNLELDTKVKPQTVFKIGSISKQIIATAALLLAEEGKLRTDHPITKYLDGAPASWNAVTINHLLSHTSGLPRESPGYMSLKPQSDADVIKAAYGVSFLFQPGERFEYCNLGYFILAEIIHKASGMPWPEFVKQRIFAPLGMPGSQVTDTTAIVSERASGYAVVNGSRQNAATLLAVRPSGAFMSSLEDLVKWNAALDARKVLPAATWERAWTPVTLNNGSKAPYGLGWYIEDLGRYHMVHHGGSINGFRAQYSRFAEQRFSIIVLANGEAARTDLMALRIAEQFMPGLLPQRKPIQLSVAELGKLVGKYEYPGLGVATFSIDGSALRGHFPILGPPVLLLPESSTAFYSEDDPRQLITFSRDDRDLAVAIVSVNGREVARGKKVPAAL
jgi:D-alanyl-D-alanine carboxypeptidase